MVSTSVIRANALELSSAELAGGSSLAAEATSAPAALIPVLAPPDEHARRAATRNEDDAVVGLPDYAPQRSHRRRERPIHRPPVISHIGLPSNRRGERLVLSVQSPISPPSLIPEAPTDSTYATGCNTPGRGIEHQPLRALKRARRLSGRTK